MSEMKPERFFIRPESASQVKALEDALIRWINEIRAQRGLPPLQEGDGDDNSIGGETDGK